MTGPPPPDSSEEHSLPSATRWDTDETAAGYGQWDNAICWTFGYPFAIEELRLPPASGGPVLDLGCGPGHVTEHLAVTRGLRVIGADASPGMIRFAREHHAHPLVEYVLMQDGGLGFLDEESIAGAVCCFVFITIAEIGTIRSLVSDVHRALRPGARLVVLDVHPGSIGVRFTAFQAGEQGRTYTVGEPMRTELFVPGGAIPLRDHHWSQVVYTDVLAEAGLHDITRLEPVLADAEKVVAPELLRQRPWEAERTRPPFLIVGGTKAGGTEAGGTR